jgi:predicted nucleotidyltransferase
MALSKDEVIEIVNGFLKVIRQKHDVREAYLFGSFAQGTPKEYSDIDLAIVLGSVRSSDVLLLMRVSRFFTKRNALIRLSKWSPFVRRSLLTMVALW